MAPLRSPYSHLSLCVSSYTPGNLAWVERGGFFTHVKMSSGLVGALLSMGCLGMVN